MKRQIDLSWYSLFQKKPKGGLFRRQEGGCDGKDATAATA